MRAAPGGSLERMGVSLRVAGAWALALAVALVTPATTGSDDLETAVARYIKPYVATNNFSGVVLVARNGRAVVRQAYGHANVELSVPNRLETKFHIASVSKSFTAAAILLLQQQGRLDVHDPVGRFISGYPNGDRLTLHHLLTHTSGISNVNDLPDYDRRSRFTQTLTDIVGSFRDEPLEFEPGTRYRYSNSNYNLLALVIERASGRTFGAFLRERIFAPLGLGSTGHDGDVEAVVAGMAAGYVPEGLRGIRRAPFLDWTIKTGNGSLYSTVDDLLTWTRTVRTPGFFTPKTLELMFEEHVDGVGYGWFVRKGQHRSVAMTGRSPGFSASVEQSLDDDVTVIVLSNLYSGVSQTIAADLVALARGEQRSPLVPAEFVGLPAATVDAVVGRYRFGDDFTYNPGVVVSVERNADALRMVGNERMGSSYLIPLDQRRFLDRSYGGQVAFESAEDGTITGLSWSFGRPYRAERQR